MRTLVAVAMLAISGIASAQITKSAQGYLFRMKHQVGSTVRYGVLSSLTGASDTGKPIQFSVPMVWKVLGVTNGVASVEATVGPVMLGKSPVIQARRTRMQIDARGRAVGQAGTGQQVLPALPEKAIKVGQSWTASAPIDLPTGGNSKKVTATYTFKGFKTVNGKQMAELAVKTSGQASGGGTMLIQSTDGMLFRSNLKMKLAMTTPNGTSNYNFTADITRK